MSYKDVNGKNQARLTGQAGVYRVASEMLLRGFNPRFPAVDCGADLEVDGGVRIQVKSCHLRYNDRVYPQGAYWFKFWRNPIVTGQNNIKKRCPPSFSETCDFVILWGIEQNRFWIVPSAVLDGCSLVTVGPDTNWIDADISAIKQLHADGLSQVEIAKRLGLNWATVARRIKGFYLEPKRSIVAAVRKCEGRWEYIREAVDTLVQATLAASDHETVVVEKE